MEPRVVLSNLETQLHVTNRIFEATLIRIEFPQCMQGVKILIIVRDRRSPECFCVIPFLVGIRQ